MTLPYNIQNGQAIDATPVMANFVSLDGRLPSGGVVAAASGANSDITSLAGLSTPLSIAQGGTGQGSQTAALAALLGSSTVPVANGGTGDAGTAWSTQTVTPTAASGTFTSASATWRFKVIGKTAFFSLNVLITTNGTAAGTTVVPLPTGWVAKATHGYGGRETAVTGVSFNAQILGTTSTMAINKYDGTYLGGNSYNLAVSGVLELT